MATDLAGLVGEGRGKTEWVFPGGKILFRTLWNYHTFLQSTAERIIFAAGKSWFFSLPRKRLLCKASSSVSLARRLCLSNTLYHTKLFRSGCIPVCSSEGGGWDGELHCFCEWSHFNWRMLYRHLNRSSISFSLSLSLPGYRNVLLALLSLLLNKNASSASFVILNKIAFWSGTCCWWSLHAIWKAEKSNFKSGNSFSSM